MIWKIFRSVLFFIASVLCFVAWMNWHDLRLQGKTHYPSYISNEYGADFYTNIDQCLTWSLDAQEHLLIDFSIFYDNLFGIASIVLLGCSMPTYLAKKKD